MNKSTLAIAIAALLVGGVAVAAYQKFHQPDASAVVAAAPAAVAASPTSMADLAQDDSIASATVNANGRKSSPTWPPTRPMGRKTATVASVEAVIAEATSRVPVSTASDFRVP